MVDKKHKGQMVDFIVHRLEEAGKYQILQRDIGHVLVTEKPATVENPTTIDVLMHHNKMPIDEFLRAQRLNKEQGTYTAHVFYKDGKEFMVRLAKRGKIKDEKSLKDYSREQIDAMVHLRKLEKKVLERFSRFPRLAYYQPPTVRLSESVRFFDMQPVTLDYSHIGPDDPGYNRLPEGGRATSLDYKLPNPAGMIATGPLFIITGKSSIYLNGLLHPEATFKK